MNLRKFVSLYLYLLFLIFDSLSRLCISIIRLALLAVFIKLLSMTLLYKKLQLQRCQHYRFRAGNAAFSLDPAFPFF